jgi:hypothetical protein
MWRKPLAISVVVVLIVGVTSTAGGQMSKEAKIRNAMAAGPAGITKYATIMEWPDKNGKMVTLREGTNGWTCFPSQAPTKYRKNDAGCYDAVFMQFNQAMMNKQPPALKTVGYSYMLTSNDWGSNTDAEAKGPAAGNQWHHMGPHVMIVYPDLSMLTGLPTQPSTIGPYVMYAGTPYAHVMWPLK